MKNVSREKWDTYYETVNAASIINDNWLQKHEPLFGTNEKILELGCGFAANSVHLSRQGHDVLATDYSDSAIKKLSMMHPSLATKKMTILEASNLPENSYDTIIADLCLHYFPKTELEEILSGLNRVVRKSGKLFARLNSASGNQAGIMVDENFYYQDGTYRMFFTESMVHSFWSGWELLSIKNYTVHKYGKEKNLFEIVCRSSNSQYDKFS